MVSLVSFSLLPPVSFSFRVELDEPVELDDEKDSDEDLVLVALELLLVTAD
jgi:hypothetical protein